MITALTISLAATLGHALDWPQWRGPSGNGVSGSPGFMASPVIAKGRPLLKSDDELIAVGH